MKSNSSGNREFSSRADNPVVSADKKRDHFPVPASHYHTGAVKTQSEQATVGSERHGLLDRAGLRGRTIESDRSVPVTVAIPVN